MKAIILKMILKKVYFEGVLKIDEFKSKNNYALIDNFDKIYIQYEKERNRGLDGDRVVIKLLKENSGKKRGKIIFIKYYKFFLNNLIYKMILIKNNILYLFRKNHLY